MKNQGHELHVRPVRRAVPGGSLARGHWRTMMAVGRTCLSGDLKGGAGSSRRRERRGGTGNWSCGEGGPLPEGAEPRPFACSESFRWRPAPWKWGPAASGDTRQAAWEAELAAHGDLGAALFTCGLPRRGNKDTRSTWAGGEELAAVLGDGGAAWICYGGDGVAAWGCRRRGWFDWRWTTGERDGGEARGTGVRPQGRVGAGCPVA